MNIAYLDAVTHGLGVAISPLVLIVLVVILLSPRARPNGAAFLAGWLTGLVMLGGIVFAVGGFGSLGDDPRLVAQIDIAFGLILLGLACRSWLRRDRSGGTSRWLSAADRFSVTQAAAAGCFFAAIYPKNLILAAVAASELAALGGNRSILTYLLFVGIGSTTIAGPVMLYLSIGSRVQQELHRAKSWLSAQSSTIMILLLSFFGLKLLIGGVLKAMAAGF
ncbi:GAP family protein [Xanthobacter autotrophicus]|uniref:GAP family protein n=1 Tax=Xanthobacter TaxID=279 RepID=UPI0024AA54A5|nr:GAP family protein [Xanthobacter autotrophicus]MDI4665033.1 GAP family protein [Xanthobacter autotrophicus]